MPTVLCELMRHASINTTMAYYVGTNAAGTAALPNNWAGVLVGYGAMLTESFVGVMSLIESNDTLYTAGLTV